MPQYYSKALVLLYMEVMDKVITITQPHSSMMSDELVFSFVIDLMNCIYCRLHGIIQFIEKF